MFFKKKKKEYQYEFKLTPPSGPPIIIAVTMSPEVWYALDEQKFVEMLLSQFLDKTSELKSSK